MKDTHTQTALSILSLLGLRLSPESLPKKHNCNNPLSCVDLKGRHTIADLAPPGFGGDMPLDPPGYHWPVLIHLGQGAPVELWLFCQDEETCSELGDAAFQLQDFLA